MADQGFFVWPGIDNFFHGQFSFTHGASPSLATLYIAPPLNPGDLQQIGQLQIVYGGTVMFFPDCLLDFVSIERSPDGQVLWGLHILDRRWMWKDLGRISGNYNIRRGEGDGEQTIWPITARNPQQLATLCFEALGEPAFDVSGLPEDDFPETEWDYRRPAEALLELTDRYGCRIVLGLDNAVRVLRANEGESLDESQYMSGGATINPPNMPSRIIGVLGKTIVQYDFILEAVGLETDGSIIPIDELSYKPANGWDQTDIEFWNDVREQHGEHAATLAAKSVFRWYRIKTPISIPEADPINPANGEIEDRRFVLPLLDVQINKSEPTIDEPATNLPAWVYGVWYDKQSIAANTPADGEVDPDIQSPDASRGFYPYDFELDKARGIVKFADTVYQLNTNPFTDANLFDPAKLRLRTSFNLRDQETMGWVRYEVELDTPTSYVPTQPLYVTQDDVAFKVTCFVDSAGDLITTDDNENEANDAAAFAIQGALQKLQYDNPTSFTYPGFRYIELDGAIQQVTWIVDGEGLATTQANRNKEDLVNSPSYEEAKQAARLQSALADAEKSSRVLKQNMAQNGGWQ
jgi:hypothetical protein